MKKLSISLPLFLSPMAGVGSTELAAAVANCGGLGALGLGASTDPAKIRDQIREVRNLTKGGKGNFQVNFFCHEPVKELDQTIEKRWLEHLARHFRDLQPSPIQLPYKSFLEDDGSVLDVILQEKPCAVSFHFGLPRPDQLSALKSADILTIASATCVDEATSAAGAGVEIIVAQGVSAGGHRGTFNPTQEDPNIDTEELVTALVAHKALRGIPIVAAGGIASSTDVRRVLSLGASAVQVGTAFIHCRESLASDAYRSVLCDRSDGCGYGARTQITKSISGRPARCVVNGWHVEVDADSSVSRPVYPLAYSVGKQLARSFADAGDPFSFSTFFAGAACFSATKVRDEPAADVVARLFEGAKANP